MADVFISYHEKSAGELAAKIAAALESVGISCWYAKRDIPPGGDFARYIPPQIKACKVFLLILNESVYQSHHIENEVGLAFSRLNKGEPITILPLEIGDFERKTWAEYYLIHTQSVKIPCLDETHMQEIIQKISIILGRRTAFTGSEANRSPLRSTHSEQTVTQKAENDNAHIGKMADKSLAPDMRAIPIVIITLLLCALSIIVIVNLPLSEDIAIPLIICAISLTVGVIAGIIFDAI